MEAYSSMAKPSGYMENLSMTAKQPPSYDGKVSWFRYEELVDDWVTITTVEAPVNYFKNTLKKYCLKRATNVYLYRLLSFFNHRRQTQEFLIFTSKYKILLMRLKAAWMDLMPVFTAQSLV